MSEEPTQIERMLADRLHENRCLNLVFGLPCECSRGYWDGDFFDAHVIAQALSEWGVIG